MGKVAQMPIDHESCPQYNSRSMARITTLRKFESLAQDLVEGSLGRLLGSSTLPRDLALKLARHIESSQHNGVAGNEYIAIVAPDDYKTLYRENAGINLELSRFLLTYINQVGYSVNQPVSVKLLPADDVNPGRPIIVSSCSVTRLESTKEMPAVREKQQLEDLRTADAFLIKGKRHISLDRPIISIGRHLDNDLVIDSRAVSRHHAQIRWQHGKYVLHDLGSKGGIMVNNRSISERVLRPGDVITIGPTSYVYGEGLTPLDNDGINQSGDGTTISMPGGSK